MKVLAVTGTRADWGLLAPVLALMRDDRRFDLRVAVTGQHLSPAATSRAAIETDGFSVDYSIDMMLGEEDGYSALCAAMGRATAGMGQVLADFQPDMVLVLGDRYEILSMVSAAVVAKVPVVHLCGGDVTEGAIDDSIRHAITKIASLHFVTNAEAARRVRQLGENPAHVFNVGSTGLDRIRLVARMDRRSFFDSVGLEPADRNFLVTFHPPTLSDDAERQCETLLAALRRFPDVGLIFTGSNADTGGRAIDRAVKAFVATRDNAVFHVSLGSEKFFSALDHVDLVVGNSSSGLYEAPSFCVPTVNIGDRQARRPRAGSVIDCEASVGGIVAAIESGLTLDCSGVVNPYGDGHAAERIVAQLAAIDDPRRLIRKSFVDVTG
ncbi:UDP-N-acetylglucosamine 2-epimerase [Fodinicurvata sp. EGI_FJ10296]|uniref:UDP-N-acetylglucosamine 2-epimerase n=1 Tax=Fodinicurvata sp. EGI_FJ10296 TaxID=3231908 RepID=UPI00345587D7